MTRGERKCRTQPSHNPPSRVREARDEGAKTLRVEGKREEEHATNASDQPTFQAKEGCNMEMLSG